MKELNCPACKTGVVQEIHHEVYIGTTYVDSDGKILDTAEDDLERTDAYLLAYYCDCGVEWPDEESLMKDIVA